MLGIKPIFEGKGLNEICYDKKNGKKIIIIDKKYFRVQDVDRLKGNSYKIKTILKWKPKFNFENLVEHMVKEEIENFNSNKKISI